MQYLNLVFIYNSDGEALACFETNDALYFGDYVGGGSVAESNVRTIIEEIRERNEAAEAANAAGEDADVDPDAGPIVLEQVGWGGSDGFSRITEPGPSSHRDDAYLGELAVADALLVEGDHGFTGIYFRVDGPSTHESSAGMNLPLRWSSFAMREGSRYGMGIIRRLENYALLDEEDHGRIEMERFDIAYEEMSRRNLHKAFPAWLVLFLENGGAGGAEGDGEYLEGHSVAVYNEIDDAIRERAFNEAGDDYTYIDEQRTGQGVIREARSSGALAMWLAQARDEAYAQLQHAVEVYTEGGDDKKAGAHVQDVVILLKSFCELSNETIDPTGSATEWWADMLVGDGVATGENESILGFLRVEGQSDAVISIVRKIGELIRPAGGDFEFDADEFESWSGWVRENPSRKARRTATTRC